MWNTGSINTARPEGRPTISQLAMLALCLVAVTSGQVNTEAMRRADSTLGWHAGLAADLGIIAGNSSLVQLRSNLRLDYLTERGRTFFVTQYQTGTQGDSLFLNKGFAHLRGVRYLRHSRAIEGFVQQEFNEFINLRSRSLVGGGLRLEFARPADSTAGALGLNLGIGLMWEREALTGEAQEIVNLLRSTNYVVLRWTADDRLVLFSTAYFQVDTGSLSDYRIIWDGGLSITLFHRLALNLKVDLRYDSEPPGEVKSYDIELTNGLSYSF